MRKTLIAIFLMLIFACAVPPHAEEFEIHWTAPGDDGSEGMATGYELVYSVDSMVVVLSENGNDGWKSLAGATLMLSDQLPTPDTSGTSQSFVITGLNSGVTYYIAIKAFDEVGNYASSSNIIAVMIPDTMAPAVIILRIVG